MDQIHVSPSLAHSIVNSSFIDDRWTAYAHEWNRASSCVCGTLMALGSSLPPTHPVLYDSSAVFKPPLHPWLGNFGQAFENANPPAIPLSLPVADISPSYSPISDFGEITPPLASVRNANADDVHQQAQKDTYRPYHCSTMLLNRRKARQPAATYEPNIIKLQERLRREGGDQDAVTLVESVFPDEVTLEALTRRQTREEAAQQIFGQGGGPVYLAFLETSPLNKRDNGASGVRFRCRLCPNNTVALYWKHHRDVLRHLKRDHFGLGETCIQWYVCSLV